MASLNVSTEELSCPMCHEIFKDPVLISCSHVICPYTDFCCFCASYTKSF
uniref:Zinc finger RING-type eukaryotic domain-containing protein n=1 Tax=Sinocyclocheilus anshuiensis TaxID=1608454 RepID=A0A671PAJ2_9TELE